MTRYLVATRSVHTTAAACDYLDERLEAGDDVIVLAVGEGGQSDRDAGDATNVAAARLPSTPVETIQRTGDPGTEILAAARDRDVDEILLGARSGDPSGDSGGLGSTTGHVLARTDRPVVVLPIERDEW